MTNIHIPPGWEIKENEITPEAIYLNRREFMVAGGFALGMMGLNIGCAPGRDAIDERPEIMLTEIEKKLYPAKRLTRYKMDRRLTEESIAAGYNNYYEFSETKEDVDHHAQTLKVRPWEVEVGGLVENPLTMDVQEIIQQYPLEERFYRLRCVEAWAMAVPWTGFPLKALIDKVKPKNSATFVKFTSFHQPATAQGQLAFWQPWPYSESISIDEAINEMSFLATGIYGHPLSKQHGSPIRLVIPWKYGFKSIKAIKKIEFVDHRPLTFWNSVQSDEYGFIANVDPSVPHPRWAQTTEKMLGTGEVIPTQLYNGYGDFVAKLY